jgi:hypothetical protein
MQFMDPQEWKATNTKQKPSKNFLRVDRKFFLSVLKCSHHYMVKQDDDRIAICIYKREIFDRVNNYVLKIIYNKVHVQWERRSTLKILASLASIGLRTMFRSQKLHICGPCIQPLAPYMKLRTYTVKKGLRFSHPTRIFQNNQRTFKLLLLEGVTFSTYALTYIVSFIASLRTLER